MEKVIINLLNKVPERYGALTFNQREGVKQQLIKEGFPLHLRYSRGEQISLFVEFEYSRKHQKYIEYVYSIYA